MSIRSQFGKPKLTPSTGPQIFRLKGDKATSPEIYRVLPPMKSGANDGTWASYHAQHFGYTVPNPKDPSKFLIRTFKCIRQKDRTGMITVECPECKSIEATKAKREAAVEKLKKMGKSEAEIKSMVHSLDDWLRNHNVDGKWYIAVKSLAGPAGALAIPHKMKLELQRTEKKLKDEDGVDIFDIDGGAWLHFQRSGAVASEMNFKIEAVMEEEIVNGKRMKSIKPAPLSDDDLETILREVPDIKKPDELRMLILNAEQIQQLVDTGGDPELVEQILNSVAPVRHEASPTPRSSPAPAPTRAAPPAPEPVVDDVDVELPEPPKPAAKPVAAAPKAASKPVAPVEVPSNVENMSDDEFLAMFQ